MIDLKRRLVLWSSFLLLALSLPAAAHNGALATAVPVAGITIDGDFSDWPAGMTRYPIALPGYGIKPKDARDFQGSFRIGYSAPENALYLAVEMQDESAVTDTLNPTSRYTQDGCEVWVDAIDLQVTNLIFCSDPLSVKTTDFSDYFSECL